jgi:hypothetical protein
VLSASMRVLLSSIAALTVVLGLTFRGDSEGYAT